jgi:N-acetylglutamate synthase-like GNAT family acetyltransferase
MAEIVVREAVGADDIEAVRSLLQAYGEYLAANPTGAANICIEGYSQELERLSDRYVVLLLATVDGTAAGCVALRQIPADAFACEMKRLWVGGAFRGLGLGRRLVEEAIQWARRMELKTMYLDTVPAAMPEANRLYAAVGFETVERYNENPLPGVEFFRLSLDGRQS